MIIDPFSVMFLNAISSLLMGVSLIACTRSYLAEIRGLKRWAYGSLLYGLGFIIFILKDFIPNIYPLLIAPSVILLALSFYFHALVEFKETNQPIQWVYWLTLTAFILQSYFVLVSLNIAIKIVIVAFSVVVLTLASAFLLILPYSSPLSHKITGYTFITCTFILLTRAIYYLVFAAPEQSVFAQNSIQTITYLASNFFIVAVSFGFLLMCSDKYFSQQKRSQIKQQHDFERLQKIASNVPGVVYQFKMNKEGEFSAPYCSDGVYFTFNLSPKQVYEDVNCIFKRIYPEDLDDFMQSIYDSAKNLTHWKYEFRVQFEDGSIHWLTGSAAPQENEDKSILWHGFVTDITERKHIEQQLLDNGMLIRSVLNSLSANLAVLNANAQIIAVNKAWQQFANQKGLLDDCQNEVGKNYFQICEKSFQKLNKEDAKLVQQGIKDVLQGIRKSFYLEHSCHTSAHQCWFAMTVLPLHHSHGGVVISHEDITHRKQIEAELILNNKRLTALIEAIPDAIFFKDNEGRWLITNEAAKQLFKLHEIAWQGKTEEELAQMRPEFRLTHETCLEDDEKAWEAGKLMLFCETVVTENNEKLNFEVRKVPVFDEQGNRQALVIIGRDVTELRNTEQELKKLSGLQQLLMEIASTYINLALEDTESTIQASLSKIGKFVHADRAYIFDYNFQKQYTRNTYKWCADGISPQIDELQKVSLELPNWIEIHQRGDTVYIADVLSLPKSALRDILESQGIKSLLSVPMMHFNECLGFVGFDSVKDYRIYSDNEVHLLTIFAQMLVNVKQRKAAEQQLHEAKETAIAANQAKSEFLANISHEIRTPMNAILGFSNILVDLVKDKYQQHYLEGIRSSGKVLLQLINDILDLSKIEAGKLEINLQPIDIKSIFYDISTIFIPKLTEKGIAFILDLPDDIPKLLYLDDIRLRQVLLNLIGNAVKFTEHGFIRVSLLIEPTQSKQHISAIIKISDSGIGIAKNQCEAIFSAFTQQKNQSVQYGGTGLGLTICKRLVEIMDGKISVNSELGEGSCFTVELSNIEIAFSVKKPLVEENQISGKINFQPAKLLLVDDITMNRNLIKIYLQDYSTLHIVEAENGAQTLDLINSQQFDLILMDRKLPDEDGDSICKKIKALANYATVPIIMITASASSLSEKKQIVYYELELHKPIDKTELLNVLQSFLKFEEQEEHKQKTLKKQTTAQTELTVDKQQELYQLLTQNYQTTIKEFRDSGALQIDSIINIAEALIEKGKKYQYHPLIEWADALKTQAELFDLGSLTNTLIDFEELILQLKTE